jgi:hypothetical protein
MASLEDLDIPAPGSIGHRNSFLKIRLRPVAIFLGCKPAATETGRNIRPFSCLL